MKEKSFKLEWKPRMFVNKQHMFTTEQLKEMHHGIKYLGKLKEYFNKTKEKLKLMHLYTVHQHNEEELNAETAILLTWPFLGKELLDEETVFNNSELILILIKDEIQN